MATKKVNFTERRKEIVKISCRHLMVAGLFIAGIASYSLLAGTARGMDLPQPNFDIYVDENQDGTISYNDDIKPFFTQPSAWFDRNLNLDLADDYTSFACSWCHGGNTGEEVCPPKCHLMYLGSHAGMLAGADVEDGCGEPILGQDPGCTNTGFSLENWEESVLRWRLRNNRMPPGSPFMLDESNRNGPDITTHPDKNDLRLGSSRFAIKIDANGDYEYSCCDDPNPNAVDLIGAWVMGTNAGLNESNKVSYGGVKDVKWKDVEPFFTQRNTWFKGSLACTYCHYCNDEPPCYHAMDLSSPKGIRKGADVEDGCGEPILGQGPLCTDTNFDWEESVLRKRLRNNRMPPNAPFVLNESNRNGRTLIIRSTGEKISAVDLIGGWVGAGAPNN